MTDLLQFNMFLLPYVFSTELGFFKSIGHSFFVSENI